MLWSKFLNQKEYAFLMPKDHFFFFREMKLEQWKYITAQREIYNFTILQVSVDEWQ